MERLRKNVSQLEQKIQGVNRANLGETETPLDQMIGAEINRANNLEFIIEELSSRINAILEELAQENSLTDNTEEIRQMLHMMSISSENRSVSLGESLDFKRE